MTEYNVSRRTLLRGAGTSLTGTALVGQATADPDDDRYVVGIRPDRGVGAVRRAANSVDRELEFGSIGTAVSGRFSAKAVDALEKNPNVRYVERNGLMHAIGQATPDGIARIEADVAIDAGETGDGASVAVLDTGIDAAHEDLAANLGAGAATEFAACSDGCGDADCLESWDDDHGHGTHIAGIVGAIDNDVGVMGVAPAVTLHAVKVLRCDGAGAYDDIAAGIQWATEQGHDVVNMSLGGEASAVVRDAVRYADQHGVVLVAAAGNDGPCIDCVSYPAAYDEVIAVSATDADDELADFSSTGPEIDLAAPGVSVRSTLPGNTYENWSGTSMASPHVAGSAAQLLATGTDAPDVRERLEATADDVGLADDEQGAGRVNVAAALGLEDDGNDDGDDGSDGDDGDTNDGTTAPVIERLSIRRRTTGPWSRANVDWTVTDDDGDLESVTTELLDGDRVVDRETTSVSGSSASGEDELRTRGGTDSVRVTVADDAGHETIVTR